MSNYLAVATVTAALAQIVQAAAQKAVGGAEVDVGRPSASANSGVLHKVHLYLYQVSPNAALRNADLPTRDSRGKLTLRPQVALDLHYLLAFYGNEKALEPERMLGAVVRDLHARPLLTRQAIEEVITNNSNLTGSNLAEAVESVKFTPLSLSLDELSKLWSVFFQTPHALSVVYQGTVVLIEAEETATPALPVLRRGDQDRGVDTLLGPFPILEGVHFGEPESAGQRPRPLSYPCAQLGLRLTLSGNNLGGESVRVELKHPLLDAVSLAPVSVTANEIAVDLPKADDPSAQDKWAAGMYTVRVIAQGGGRERTSNALPLALATRILQIEPPSPIPRVGGTATLTLTCSPQVLPKQNAALLLADREVAAQAHPTATDKLTFVVENAPAVADALVRVRVDGVDSLPFTITGSPPQPVFDDEQRVSII